MKAVLLKDKQAKAECCAEPKQYIEVRYSPRFLLILNGVRELGCHPGSAEGFFKVVVNWLPEIGSHTLFPNTGSHTLLIILLHSGVEQ